MIRRIAICCICFLMLMQMGTAFAIGKKAQSPVPKNPATDEEFMDVLQYASLQFFLEQADKSTGLVKDRADNFKKDNYTIASVAAVGFALPSYIIGAERGWMSKKDAYERIQKTLVFFRDKIEQEHGFYYHFVDMKTGKHIGTTELSSIDTALFLGGVLVVRQYYQGTEIESIAAELINRVDWKWMLNESPTLSMGWKELRNGQGRFLDQYWNDYSESLMMYLMAIGSSTHSIPASSWDAINRPIGRYGEHILISSPPLFTHQYSHAFVDFKNKHDKYADYFSNSISATLANREYCLDNAQYYATYSENVWGLTACDGPNGYQAYGAKPGHAYHDGTVAPCAAAGSIVFTPDLSIKALRYMYDTYHKQLWGKYGFSDAFNLDKNWFATDVIGIDVGIMMLMIENYRTGMIWKNVMQNVEIHNAMKAVGFEEGSRKMEMPPEVRLNALKRKKNIFLDGDLREWKGLTPFHFDATTYLESGAQSSDQSFSADIYFLWDDEYLYVGVQVGDDTLFCRKGGDSIFKNDCLELYFDPGADGLIWGSSKDLQIGFCPDIKEESKFYGGKSWSGFQNENPLSGNNVMMASGLLNCGYTMEIAIRWSYIGFYPAFNSELRMTPAFYDVDKVGTQGAKYNVFFQDTTGKDDRKKLALLTMLQQEW